MDLGGFDLLRLSLLVGAGVLAGFINVNAGGGSLITLPALLFLGMPATAANATNRVGIALQNVSASTKFRREGRLPLRLAATLLLPAVPGAVIGANLALELDEVGFRRLLACVLILVLVAILKRPARRAETQDGEAPRRLPHPILLYTSFFFIGVYGGLIQAGAGFILMAALTQFAGLDLIRTNAVKVFVVLFLQLVSLIVFQGAGEVNWTLGLCLGAGTMLGAWIGAHVQMRRGEVWVRRFLIVAVAAFALKLLLDSFR